jgi:hypothetical protein
VKRGVAAAVALLALGAGLGPAAKAGEPGGAVTRLEPRAGSAASRAVLRMSIDTRKVRFKRRIPRSFVGLSVEFQTLRFLTGTAATGTNPVTEGLFRELRAAGSGAPLLRVGGGSADTVWWNPLRRRPRPLGIQRDFTDADASALAQFRSRTGMPLIVALNLASRDPSIATTLAQALVARLGPGAFRAFEVGNEPDIYGERRYYLDSAGRYHNARNRNYDFGNYLFDFRARARSLRAAVPRLPLAGPGACCKPEFTKGLPLFLRRERKRVRLISYHEYFGAACPGVGRRNPGFPTRNKLLGPKVIERVTNKYASLVQIARRYRKPVRLTETNSFACGGKPGLSDTFTASLWGADYMMRMAAIGMNGMDFHTFAPYSPFALGFQPGVGYVGTAQPLFYGMLAFARATANRATILLDPTITARVRRGVNLVPFVTLDRRRTLRVLVINKDSRRGGPARIRVRRGAATARLTRLLAPGLGAKTGVTMAGQSVPALSRDGRLTGPVRAAKVRRRGGAYRFRVPAASAALLELKLR